MKNFSLLFFTLLPFFAFGQNSKFIELYATPNYSYRTNSITSDQGRIGYNFGLALSGPLKTERLHWLAGLQFSTFGSKYKSGPLRWGTQHNGEGGFDPNLPGESVTRVNFRKAYFYFEMPLGVRYFLTQGKVKFFVQPTVNPALFLTQRTDAEYTFTDRPNEQNTTTGNSGNFRTLNLHAALGAGIEFPLSGKLILQLMPQGSIQAFSAAKNSTTGSRLYSLGLRAGLKFGL